MTPAETVAAWRAAATRDPEGFWAAAAEKVPWSRRWDTVFAWDPPTFRWFVGGETNLAYNCLDAHVNAGGGDRIALITENERGERRERTYAELLEQARSIGRGLRALGIGRGDRVAIYMPTCEEAIALMLGAIRIGAVIIVVFAGFGSGALGERVRLAGAKAVFATDSTYRKGKDVPLKAIVDLAVADCPSVERVVVLKRGPGEISWDTTRDETWEEFLRHGAGQDDAHAVMESNEPAYILATSGTTAKPKLAVHTHGGYQVYVYSMAKWMFGNWPDTVPIDSAIRKPTPMTRSYLPCAYFVRFGT